MEVLRTFIFTFLFLFTISFTFAQSEVLGLKYYMEYDTSMCRYDCSIIITDGNAASVLARAQFNAQYTIVVPTGTTLEIAERYMPLVGNQSYQGTTPMDWTQGISAINVNGEGIDYHIVSPKLSPASFYNNILEGDTIKLFSVTVADNTACGTGVRFFENDVDVNVNNGDFSCGFTIGGPSQDYEGNEPVVYPPNIDLAMPSVDNSNGIWIDLVLDPPASCQSSCIMKWSGPNNFSSDEEDVLIEPAAPEDYGMFKVVVQDEIDCIDSLEVMVSSQSIVDVEELTLTNIIYTPTYEHIAVHANIEGDDNTNSTFEIEYRLTGEQAYKSGAISMRATPGMIVNGSSLDMNFHAGSVMHLLPNSSYDLRITIVDVDGGSQVIEHTLMTKKFPTKSDAENVKYVIPGNGGGDGSISNPFKGLQTAVDNVIPGCILEVADGTYSPVSMSTSGTEAEPILIKSTSLHGAVINGNNTSQGIITLGTAIDSIRYIIIDGFEIKNGKWAIDAQNTQYLTVRNNKLNDVDYGFYNRRENGWEHDQYIHNNEFVGRTQWPQLDGSIPSERGIDIRGNANVVSHNSISDFGDGISTDGPASQMSYALDIHDNFITRVVDDIIEVDGTISNTRVYRNYGINGRMGVSVAPIYGGPTYVFRNVLYNLESSAFKMNNQTAGLVILNNSIAKSDRGLTSSAGWQNTIFKNNAVLSGHYVMEEYGLVAESSDDWDNNAYFSQRSGTSVGPWFKWDNVKYNNIAAIVASGITEANSMATSYSDFMSMGVPSNYGTEATTSSFNFELATNSSLINAGETFDNIFDNDIQGGTVDIGALEVGNVLPSYGHDFSLICERLDMSIRTWNGNISTGWYHPSNWSPCGVPEKLTDVFIPSGLTNYPFINSNIFAKDASILEGGYLELTNESTFTLEGINSSGQ